LILRPSIRRGGKRQESPGDLRQMGGRAEKGGRKVTFAHGGGERDPSKRAATKLHKATADQRRREKRSEKPWRIRGAWANL